MESFLHANVDRFSGFADCYDAYRPQPPKALVGLLTQLARVEIPELVVDLGCGTGLSTRIWAKRANHVIGIEPNNDMRQQAIQNTLDSPEIVYRDGISTHTGLPDGCADIVVCSQSLHWMEPEPTFAEIARILRVGGVFASCDCDWPPTMDWEAEAAYNIWHQTTREAEKRMGTHETVKRWSKDQHLERIQKSDHFRYVREVLLHNVEYGGAERLVGLALSQGGVETLLKHGLSKEEVGITKLIEDAHRIFGDREIPWYFSYRIRIGVK